MIRTLSRWLVVAAVALVIGAVGCSNDKLQCKKNADCATGYVCTYGACFKANGEKVGETPNAENGQ
ncbi:MAG: hypothetical protein KC609_23945 [Myxococcales bacterium]|nr:hypothetical protein [Myxococcales bacterium]